MSSSPDCFEGGRVGGGIQWEGEKSHLHEHRVRSRAECIPVGGAGVLSAVPAEEASRHPGEKVMSSRQMSPFELRPTLPSNTT